MSAADRDPLEELRARWQSLAPPTVGDDLEAEPAEVRAPLERLRDAWRALEPAEEHRDAAQLAVRAWAAARRVETAPRAAARLHARRRWGVLAVAAALFALVAGGVWVATRAERPPRGAERDYVASAVDAPAVAAPTESAPRLAAVAADRIEIRSGNVRLVWLTDPAPGTTAETNEPDEDKR